MFFVAVFYNDQKTIENHYTFDGQKLGKKVYDYRGNLTLNERYFDELLMQNGKVRRLQHADGYISLTQDGNPVEYFYYLKDHLGNIRATITQATPDSLLITQANDYYPFGMAYTPKITGLQPDSWNNKFKYNGKEEQEMPGKWLDYGFRFYDPSIVRFGTMDPIADLFSWQSSYAYAGNNPIRYIDFMGMSPVGADGLTNDQWLETSRPGADPELKKKYIAQNRNQEHQKRQMASVFSMSPEELSKRGFSGYYVTNSDGEILSHTVDGMGTFYSGGGDQNDGGALNAGHVNWFLGSTAGILGGNNGINGVLNNFKSLAAQYPSLNFSREIRLTQNISTGLKWFGRGAGAFSVGFSYYQYRSGQISGKKFGLDAAITGASFTPVIGWYIGAQYFVIDNTIGVDNFSNIMINQEIHRANMINSSNWGMGFYPHVGMGVR
jgi:RHS repeat-associated protein